MEVQVYKKIAYAINCMADVLTPDAVYMPVNAEGAVVNHLLEFSQDKKGISHGHNVGNVVQVTSKKYFDRIKLADVLMQGVIKGSVVNAIDLNADTYERMSTIEHFADSLVKEHKIDVRYNVLFDSTGIESVVRMSRHKLTDEEKKLLAWFGQSNSPITHRLTENTLGVDIYDYNITGEWLEGLKQVQEIKKHL
jgi:hypothetical protein